MHVFFGKEKTHAAQDVLLIDRVNAETSKTSKVRNINERLLSCQRPRIVSYTVKSRRLLLVTNYETKVFIFINSQ
jgi:hypothetical protein